MKSLAIVTVVGLCALATDATAQTWQPPLPNERCPSKWGAADERGSGNHMTPANVLRAAQLIKTGETFELGHLLGRDMPLNPAGNTMCTPSAALVHSARTSDSATTSSSLL